MPKSKSTQRQVKSMQRDLRVLKNAAAKLEKELEAQRKTLKPELPTQKN
jgi:hypothetical protein